MSLPMLEQPRCATCRHWVEQENALLGVCMLLGNNEDGPMVVFDAPRTTSLICTLPTFGCVLHEVKP